MLYLRSHLTALERNLLATQTRTVRLGQQPRETQAHRLNARDYSSVSVSHITHLPPTPDEQKRGARHPISSFRLVCSAQEHTLISELLFVLCLLFVYLCVCTHMSTYHSGNVAVGEQPAVNSSIQSSDPRYGTQAARPGHRRLYPLSCLSSPPLFLLKTSHFPDAFTWQRNLGSKGNTKHTE